MGFCSLPDAGCASGRRFYAAGARDGLCVGQPADDGQAPGNDLGALSDLLGPQSDLPVAPGDAGPSLITFVGSAASSDTASPAAISYPAQTAVGDLVLLLVFTEGTSSASQIPTTSTGWTVATSAYDGTASPNPNGNVALLWRRAGAERSVDLTFPGGPKKFELIIAAWRAVRAVGDPFDVDPSLSLVTTSSSANAYSMTAPSFNTTRPNTVAVLAAALTGGKGWSCSAGVNVAPASVSNIGACWSVHDGAGAVGNVTVTAMNPYSESAGYLAYFALAPAP